MIGVVNLFSRPSDAASSPANALAVVIFRHERHLIRQPFPQQPQIAAMQPIRNIRLRLESIRQKQNSHRLELAEFEKSLRSPAQGLRLFAGIRIN